MHHQVGLPVIGVVENMSGEWEPLANLPSIAQGLTCLNAHAHFTGLQVPLEALAFHNALGEDVTADVLRALSTVWLRNCVFVTSGTHTGARGAGFCRTRAQRKS